MNYEQKKVELKCLLESAKLRLKRAEDDHWNKRLKYGKSANRFSSVPRGLYLERDRLEQELEGLEYERDARAEQYSD